MGEDIASLDLQRRSRAQKDTDEPSPRNAVGLVIPREYSTPSERLMSGLQIDCVVFLAVSRLRPTGSSRPCRTTLVTALVQSWSCHQVLSPVNSNGAVSHNCQITLKCLQYMQTSTPGVSCQRVQTNRNAGWLKSNGLENYVRNFLGQGSFQPILTPFNPDLTYPDFAIFTRLQHPGGPGRLSVHRRAAREDPRGESARASPQNPQPSGARLRSDCLPVSGP